ncbi:MAG: sigma-70 family RNA polymerase sigma factor [Candidatus Eisenbacteria bacterium]|nr:sigma-70 family RNA polymerase sigma factor [Candidatus Eisenbacteria bacterium]
MAEPRDPSMEGYDWADIRNSVAHRMSYHLRGWEPSEIEDATQDVLLRVARFIRRSGPPRAIDGLTTVIARRVAVERIRSRMRRPPGRPVQEEDAVTLDDSMRRDLLDLEEDVAWKAFRAREFFRTRQTPCVELADARSQGEDFKQLAARTNQSHLALLQRWSRCMKKLRAAIANREWDWERPGGDA